MKIHNGDKQSLMISSNDVAINGSDNQTLTDVINDHTSEINDLQKNVKWLYKYGGTGSKGSGGGDDPTNVKINLNCDITFDNVTINTTTNKSSKIILKDPKTSESNLIIQLKSARPGIGYSIRASQKNLASSSSQVQYLIGSGTSRVQLTQDNEFKISKLVSNLYDEGQINIQLFGEGSTYENETFTILYVKNAYSISLSLVNNDGDILIQNSSTTSDLYSNNINNGLNLRINYNVQTYNQIPVTINNYDMFEQDDYKINVDGKGFGQLDIPIKESFYKENDGINYNTIGYNSFITTFEIPRDESINQEARNLPIPFSFNYIPNDDKFFKVLPMNEDAKIYRYSKQSFRTAIERLQQYEIIYNIYVKLADVTSLDITLLNENDLSNIAQILNINVEELSIDEIFLTIKNYIIDFEANNYMFGIGSINFNVWAYYGNQQTGIVDIHCKLSDKNCSLTEDTTEIDIGVQQINLRTKKTISFIVHESGVYVMSIYSNDTHNKLEYYFYVFDKSSNLNWYDQTIQYATKNYYRSGNTTTAFENYKNKPYIQHYSNKNNVIKLVDTQSTIPESGADDVLVAIGIQYSSINNTKNKILSIKSEKNTDTTINLDVYQNKISFSSDGGRTTMNLFLPKEKNYNAASNDNYHLLIIYKRYIYNTEGNDEKSTYEICTYLDGVLEGVSPKFTHDNSVWDSIYMYPGNYSINLCELSYFKHNKENNAKRLSSNTPLTYLDDIAISEYYYKFINTYKNDPSSIPTFDSVNELLSILRHFEETPEGMIEVTDIGKGEVTSDNEINQIASKFNVATLLLTCDEERASDVSDSGASSKNTFFNYFTSGYSEQAIDQIKPLNIQSVHYSPGKQELKLVEIPPELNGDNPWTIKIQGSSTGQYYSKNLTLGIKPVKGDTNKIGIFTPNFKYLSHEKFINSSTPKNEINEAKSSFLPETEFTLKADCVDSTHSNNNAVGAFVNDNTTQFDIDFKSNSSFEVADNNPYQHYIKNCLLGFPVLVFVHAFCGDESKTYFLGIYNFNLGRGSYFNMGYYSPGVLDTDVINNTLQKGDGKSFLVTYIDLNDKTSLPVESGVIVAEIQGGAHYNDFSQCDNSILLPQSENDIGSMFGDFVPDYNPTGNTYDDNKIKYHLHRLVENIAMAGGYLFETKLGKHLGEYGDYDPERKIPYAYNKYIDKGEYSSIFDSANQVPNYRLSYVRNPLEENKKYRYLIRTNQLNRAGTQEDLSKLITWGDEDHPNIPILDYVSCAEYYTTCMAFGLIDSVMKNLNVKTWNGVYDGNSNEDQPSTWYVAFYDMDTSFGRDNSGEDVSHFAFSDYWTSSGNSLEAATIYRDFYPQSNDDDPNVNNQSNPYTGFDVPSSYLFAIAKYANIGLGETGYGSNDNMHGAKLPNMQSSLPQNIWARWRSTVSTAGLGTLGLGELKDAESFVNKYFVRNLDEIPEQIWNMNYRFKYLKRLVSNNVPGEKIWKEAKSENGVFDDKNVKPFKGKGINFVKEWLHNRLHILDAYFNLDGVGYEIKKLNYEPSTEHIPEDAWTTIYNNDGTTIKGYLWNDIEVPVKYSSNEYAWEGTNIKDSTPIIEAKSLKSNSDIWIVQDIFSSSLDDGRQYGKDIQLRIKAEELSPLTVFETRDNTKYLLSNPETIYQVRASCTGKQYVMFGGSPSWTWIENMNPLIVGGEINIYSDKLESITLTGGICSRYNIDKMKSLKTVSIIRNADDKISTFGGSLSFIVNNDQDKFPDLTKIELIRTNISLDIDAEGVQDINLTGTTCDHVNILNCSNLQSVNLSNTKITNSCKISPAWSNDITINSSLIKELNISPKDNTQSIRRIVINRDIDLSVLTLTDFTHIEINNCTNLEKLIINSIDKVQSLKITYSNSILNDDKTYRSFKYMFKPSQNAVSQEVYLNYDEQDNIILDAEGLNCLNLSGAESLKLLSLEGTHGIDIIDFGKIQGESYEYKDLKDNNQIKQIKGINLSPRGISNTNIQKILIENTDGVNGINNPLVLFINGPATFSNCPYKYGPNQLFIKAKNYETNAVVDSLSNMFSITTMNTITPTLEAYHVSAILDNKPIPDCKSIIYENKDIIKNLSAMFTGQYNIKVSGDDTWKNDIKYLSLKSFKYVTDISGIFTNCSISRLSADLFGEGDEYLGSEVSNINITSFITSAATIEINTFKYVINKISTLISTIEKPLTFKLYNESLNITNEWNAFELRNLFRVRNVTNGIESLDLVPLENITHIIGFNIDGALNWDNAFVDDHGQFLFPNLTNVNVSFNRNINNDSTGNDINENINNWGLDAKERAITNIKNSFNINLTTPINYANVIKLDLYNGIVPATATEFNMPKYINEDDFINVLKTASNNRIISLDYKFLNIVIIKASEDDNEFKTHDNMVNTPYNFTSCNYAFAGMKFSTSPDISTNIPIKFTTNSLKYFTKCKEWNYAFANITLAQNLPLNMFNQHISGDYLPENYNHYITSLEGTFSNIKIATSQTYFRHEDYPAICIENNELLDVDKYNNGDVLDGSYHPVIEITGLSSESNLYIDNPKCKNLRIDTNNTVIYGEEIINHLILPFDIFWGCGSKATIDKCFANSDFEGILPSLLLVNNKLSVLTETFNNLLVVPNRITNYYGKDYIYLENFLLNMTTSPNMSKKLINGVLNYLNTTNTDFLNGFEENDLCKILDDRDPTGSYGETNADSYIMYQRHKTYVFVPRGFTTLTDISKAFTFKIILPKSVANTEKANQTNKNRFNSFYEQYFVFTNTSIPNGSITLMKSSLPGTFQGVSTGENNSVYELYYINSNNNTGISDVPRTLSSRAYHNIHYSLMLVEPEIINGEQQNQNFDVVVDEGKFEAIELTKRIVGQIRIDTGCYSTINYVSNLINLTYNDGEVDGDNANINIIKQYGLSYYNYGMNMTFSLIDSLLSGFMNPLLLRFLFGNIFEDGTKFTVTQKTDSSFNNKIEPIFGGVEEISVYAKLPYNNNADNDKYNNLLTVNYGYGTIALSVYNTGGDEYTYENYVNRKKYENTGLNAPFSKDDKF